MMYRPKLSIPSVLILMVVTQSTMGWAVIRYVDVDHVSGTHDGTSWATAFQKVQQGIDSAIAGGGGEVWVAEGTYNEVRTSVVGNPSIDTGSIVLSGNVNIYGGFAGNETNRDNRDWNTHATILDGSVSRSGNSAYHVIWVTANTTIDGFTITGGNASYQGNHYRGGGIYASSGILDLANCLISNNTASLSEANGIDRANSGLIYQYGGAVSGQSVVVSNCAFTQNEISYTAWYFDDPVYYSLSQTVYARGGAIYARTLSVSSSTFTQNKITGRVVIPRFDYITSFSSSCNLQGACIAISNPLSGTKTIENCTFQDNTVDARIEDTRTNADSSTGLHASAVGSVAWIEDVFVSFLKCRFQGNNAIAYVDAPNNAAAIGAGAHGVLRMDMSGAGTYVPVENCIFTGNSASATVYRVSGTWNKSASATASISSGLPNSTFYPHLFMKNCTVYGNESREIWTANYDRPGDGINIYAGGDGEIYNSIFWNDVDAELVYTHTVEYCLVKGGWSGEGNFSSDPLLDGTSLIPAWNSPCIDAGDPDLLHAPSTDILGITRPQGSAVDIGAYETPLPVVQFALASSSGSENVTSPSITVSLSTACAKVISVNYSTTGGTATGGGVDFTLSAGTLTFNPGDTSKAVPLTIVNDSLDESDETILLTLTSPVNATLGSTVTHTYTIQDNDAPPVVQFNVASSSGVESVTSPSITVGLSAASGKVITVNYSVTGGTATGGGVDFSLPNGQLTFNSGNTSKTIAFTVVNDTIDESNETVVVSLSSPANATLGSTSVHTYTIQDDDNTVPNVVGSTQSAAQTAITAAGLVVGTVTLQHSTTVPIGSVINQTPVGGTIVRPSTAVNLVVSDGTLVPNVVGNTQSAAQTAITAAGLVVGTVTLQHSTTVPIGSVISQTPVGGTIVQPSTAVNLVVSDGTLVPNVVGTNQLTAQTAITAAGLVVGAVTQQYSATVPTDLVISQSPLAEFLVNPGESVSLVVSLGPEGGGEEAVFAGITFVWCPPGSFMMGRYSGEQDSVADEDPQHQVTFIRGFWISKYEITQGQWSGIMGSNPSYFQGENCGGACGDTSNRPVEMTSWDDICGPGGFLEILNSDNPGMGFRLPSEAEWEYAARAGTNSRFYWGDDPTYEQVADHAWYSVNSVGQTHDVGTAGGTGTSNSWGLCDTSGNVWEWVQDWYHDSYTGATTDGSAWESPPGDYRVLRGNGWDHFAADVCRSANRHFSVMDARMFHTGFRLVRFDEETETIMLPGDVPLELVRIPGGTFEMGSPDGERSRVVNEGPVHTVNIGYDFYLGRYEVTQAQWLAVMGSWPGNAPSPSYGVGDSYPAYYINWDDAQNFIMALNSYINLTDQGPFTVRLPSEAERQYACRAGTTTRFHFGDSLDCSDETEDCAAGMLPGNRSDYMWYSGNNMPSGSKPVGGKIPNAFGLYDIYGNVWEWCQDWLHSESYDGAPMDGSAWESPSTSLRITLGGGSDTLAKYCRSAFRNGGPPSVRAFNLGFRLAGVPLSAEGEDEGISEGTVEGQSEGILEGNIEGIIEGVLEGELEGTLEGILEGQAEGEGVIEGEEEGETEIILLLGDVPLEMVWIPSGSFEMGSPDAETDREPDEGPVHTVALSQGFYLGKYELTQQQWLAVMGSWPGDAPSSTYGVGDNYPAYNVNWVDTQNFIAQLNEHITTTGQGPLTMRLPSEAEWEYACRAGKTTRFYWGDDASYMQIGNYAWYYGNSSDGCKPVGGKQTNTWGLHDMSGNVYEWCQDWYHDSYAGAPTDGSAWESPTASIRMFRGGGWNNPESGCRSANRNNHSSPGYRNYSIGFRLAANPFESEGVLEGQSEGMNEGEGAIEGLAEGIVEGQVEGQNEGEGQVEGQIEGQQEGQTEGEGFIEGDIEGTMEGEGEGEVPTFYSLNLTTPGHGNIKVNDALHTLPWSGTFLSDTTVNLEAVPDSGWRFANWSGGLSGNLNPTTIMMTGNMDIAANFTQIMYTLSLTTPGHGNVKVNSVLQSLPWSGTFISGTVVNLEAVADTEWIFSNWSGDLISSNNPTTVTMNVNKNIVANFSQVMYTLTLGTPGHGQVKVNSVLQSLPWSGGFASGTIVNLEAVADSGWSFSCWSWDLIGSTNPTTITMTEDKDVVANFSQVMYTLNLSTAGYGQVKVNNVLQTLPWSGSFSTGTTVNIEAVPTTGWFFSNWSGSLTGNTNPTTITMNGNKDIVVNFNQIMYSLILVTPEQGKVKVNSVLQTLPWSGSFGSWTTVNLEAVPDSGWSFAYWSTDLTGSSNPTTITMNGSKNVGVHFLQNVEGEGTIEGLEEGSIEGQPEGEGAVEGIVEGQEEGIVEGESEGEGSLEGDIEGHIEGESGTHTADQDGDGQINLSELLRVIQFFNSGGYHCDPAGEDGFAPGPGDQTCTSHDSDYNAQDWLINLSELLRVIQFFNSGGYHACTGSEDGYCPGLVD